VTSWQDLLKRSGLSIWQTKKDRRAGQCSSGQWHELDLVAIPGHSPDHLSVRISSAGVEAMLIGDVAHHPSKWRTPTGRRPWTSIRRKQHVPATRCSGNLLERQSTSSGHFVGGPIARDGEAYRIVV
jgi:glyoxylase-like metal-dependent hydrolase (beta-lactamase superfamily II)